ncbi:hypothetical protein AGMMS49975_13800 [Clostridia bacterium]|nr:hypothetical protein AGMMS49975_13800 [Clostridia bacterium]
MSNVSVNENLQEAIPLIYEAIDLIEADKTIPHNSAIYNVNQLITSTLILKEVSDDE